LEVIMSDRESLKLQNGMKTLTAGMAASKGGGAVRRLSIALAAAVIALPVAAHAATISVPYLFVNRRRGRALYGPERGVRCLSLVVISSNRRPR
jgi:hypothetical protein